MRNGEEAKAERLPTDKDMKIIGTEEAKRLFGTQADRLDGVTWLVNDPRQL